jgi:hypothetical protein
VKVSVKEWSGGRGGGVAGVRAGAAGVDLPTVSFLTSGDMLLDSDGLKMLALPRQRLVGL